MSNVLNNMEFNLNGIDSLQIPPQQRQIMQQVSDSLDFVMNNKNKLFCGESCQKDEKKDNLYQSYLKAQTNLVNAPKMLEEAERNYITFTKGGSAYNQMVYDDLKKEAKINTKKMRKKMKNMISDIHGRIIQYTDQYDYMNKINDMENMYTEQLLDEKQKVERIQKSNSISDRNTYYDTQWLEIWGNVNKLLWIILLTVTVLYVIIGVIYKQYHSSQFMIYSVILIILTVFPFVKIFRFVQDLILWN